MAERVYILAYDAAARDGDAAARDVFTQLEAVEAALRGRGLRSERLAVGLDFAEVKAALARYRDPFVFNLVESIDGSDRLQSIFTLFLESWGMRFTGSGSRAMLLSNHKIMAKNLLAAKDIPTPDCLWLDAEGGLATSRRGVDFTGTWIVKPVEAHASLFIDDTSLREFADAGAAADWLRLLTVRHSLDFFAERFIDGREFNISVLGSLGKPTVLPAAEIDFSRLAAGKPRIVGYAAKWDVASEEFAGTNRVFGGVDPDGVLAGQLRRTTEAVWTAFELNGYARVDFRVDGGGKPYVLEVNANPCLAPGSGFAAAALAAGIPFPELCLRIVGMNA